MIEAGGFIEWAPYVDQYYGTAVETVNSALQDGVDLLFDIEINGARQIKAAYPEAHGVFLLPPDFETLKNRLLGRATDDIDKVYKRLERGLVELEHAKDFDHLVVNDDLEDTISALNSIRSGAGETLPDERVRLARVCSDMARFLSEGRIGAQR